MARTRKTDRYAPGPAPAPAENAGAFAFFDEQMGPAGAGAIVPPPPSPPGGEAEEQPVSSVSADNPPVEESDVSSVSIYASNSVCILFS
jgi:hypothetical protein